MFPLSSWRLWLWEGDGAEAISLPVAMAIQPPWRQSAGLPALPLQTETAHLFFVFSIWHTAFHGTLRAAKFCLYRGLITCHSTGKYRKVVWGKGDREPQRIWGHYLCLTARDPIAPFFEGARHLQEDILQRNPPLTPECGSILWLFPEHRWPDRPRTVWSRRWCSGGPWCFAYSGLVLVTGKNSLGGRWGVSKLSTSYQRPSIFFSYLTVSFSIYFISGTRDRT